ncbi:MAG: hypothetical protein JNK45_11170 [Myxococcales bacterium]|nr:hypothetical protein [Myxococcales bacterium]
MGYTFGVRSLRQRWDWLRDLLARGRAQLALPDRGSPTRRDALRDALERLGLDDRELVEGVATVLGLDVASLRHPGPQALAAAPADDLALVLPLLLEHHSPAIRAVGRAWFGVPEAIYTVASDQAERWLLDSIATGDLLADRVDREGLAWLGPESLRRLATTAASPLARHAAMRWCDRL